jgi:S-adenosylmethionine:tRNA ribosyltransferase-isomerase
MSRSAPVTRFELPADAVATSPPEARGLARDEVRLMVARPEGISHARFHDLADYLGAGDLLVINTSATVAAAVLGKRQGGRGVVVHFSGPAERGLWIVELRDDQLRRLRDGRSGEQLVLPHGVTLTLAAAWPDATQTFGSRLWLADLAMESAVAAYLEREAAPITYTHASGAWPLSDYQTIFAEQPGSAEMVSASRPFSDRVLDDLAARGVSLAPLILHTGISSLEPDETPLPERYEVSADTADRVNETRAAGGRIVAAGTTVTRALETVADEDGNVHAGKGITDVVIGPQRPPRVVNGLITGWHEPEASHLLLLEAVAGSELVGRAYQAALDPASGGYLWHEFGDSALFLP